MGMGAYRLAAREEWRAAATAAEWVDVDPIMTEIDRIAGVMPADPEELGTVGPHKAHDVWPYLMGPDGPVLDDAYRYYLPLDAASWTCPVHGGVAR